LIYLGSDEAMMEEILSITGLKKYFVKKGLFGRKEVVRAVDDVTLSIKKGETLVLAGESGSGKTTIARLILGALEPDAGKIVFDGIKISDKSEHLKKIRMECQMVHQDPYASIDPRMTVLDIIKEPLEIHHIGNKLEQNKIVRQALAEVKLEPIEEIVKKHPHMLSGGQRQRVALARAIVTKPKLIIADEPVSMLDVSVRVGVLDLMKELQEKHGISFLYITHDLTTSKYVGHQIAIMYLGKIVEVGPINDVLSKPMHPYTQALLDSVSEPDPDNLHKNKQIRINESTNENTYQGCRFRAKCPYAIDKCKQEPELEKVQENRFSACYIKIN
jgi:peptide/nickel transport system ATP-binding protein